MDFALQTCLGPAGARVAPGLALLLLSCSAVIAAPGRAQEARPGPAADRALFDASLAAGPDSPIARDLRRRGAAAVTFLTDVLANDATPAEQLGALDHLMRMGVIASPAVPAVLAMLDGPREVAHRAVIALGELGPFLQPAALRDRCAAALLAFGSNSPHDEPTASLVARSWTRLQHPATRDLGELNAMLRSRNAFSIELACQFLCEVGPAAAPLLPTIRELCTWNAFGPGVPPPELRQAAPACRPVWVYECQEALFRMLQRVAPDDPGALPLYCARLTYTSPAEQAALVQLIGRLGADAAAAVPRLLELAQGKAPLVAREAVTALGMIGAAARDAVPVLEQLAAADDRPLAARARAALRQVRPQTDR